MSEIMPICRDPLRPESLEYQSALDVDAVIADTPELVETTARAAT